MSTQAHSIPALALGLALVLPLLAACDDRPKPGAPVPKADAPGLSTPASPAGIAGQPAKR